MIATLGFTGWGRHCHHQIPNSTHKNDEQTSNPKIKSPTTSTISANLSYPSVVVAWVLLFTDLPELQKLLDCPNNCCVPGPNSPLLQMKCLYCGTVFSCVYSTCKLKHVLKMVKFGFVKLTFLINFLPDTRSCTLTKKDSWYKKSAAEDDQLLVEHHQSCSSSVLQASRKKVPVDYMLTKWQMTIQVGIEKTSELSICQLNHADLEAIADFFIVGIFWIKFLSSHIFNGFLIALALKGVDSSIH